MTIRRLSPSDVRAYRRIRLRGLRMNPEAFGSSYGEQTKQPLKVFAGQLERTLTRWMFGAFVGRQLVGVVGLKRDERAKERHKAEIVGMYVDSDMRRKGIGRSLLLRAFETARRLRGIRRVRLAVVESNKSALRLYKAAGFEVYGREEEALLVSGKFYTELFLSRRVARSRTNHMARRLPQGAPSAGRGPRPRQLPLGR
jgi:ribosomal protein S18 acetylase RimI-like enzyme